MGPFCLFFTVFSSCDFFSKLYENLLNEYFQFNFELNIELNHFLARFNVKINNQSVSSTPIVDCRMTKWVPNRNVPEADCCEKKHRGALAICILFLKRKQ